MRFVAGVRLALWLFTEWQVLAWQRQPIKRRFSGNPIMGLFKADFYRSFAIGFALGALVVFTALDNGAANPIVSEAFAAQGE